MKTITENFNTILNQQQAIGYNYRAFLNPPATIEEIREVEKTLDLTFSNELIELYQFANGTRIHTRPSYCRLLFPIYRFSSLAMAVEAYFFHQEDFESTDDIGYFTTFDHNYHPLYTPSRKLFPFLEADSGPEYWVDLNENTENYNKIYWTEAQGSCEYHFNSLTSLFQTLAESYKKRVFSFDNQKLYEDPKQWKAIRRKYNPGLTSWNDYTDS